ncbi:MULTISPECIES: ParA family protein [Bacteroidales]|jgi:conjugative transposon protein traA family protein|uniref:Conjugative transposon protein TraA family protein n=2 Tax=Prevotella TaxID=838 RepID=A0A134B9E2_9BACT|nr:MULTISPECIES: division plane positioning ATPase MipZ [Bacteroidales]KXB76566.1 conjugative transposon protein TraA family protein [Prevotella amnii]MCE8778886.1 ParA family protein [Bacteroides thetaiotaomicron]MDR0185372.1 ParA family protein [Prevotella brunnea]
MKKKNETPIYLGFASQKGGVGKSSLAEVLAAILYYEKNIPLAVVDCDGTQESFFKLRERDRDLIESSPELGKELHERLACYGKKSYPIIRSKPESAVGDIEKYIKKKASPPQLVIFDFPGHAVTSALMDLSITMDYIISPIEADPQSLASSFAYAKTICELGIGFEGSRIQDFFLLWNKINRSASTTVIDLFTENAKEQGLTILDSRIYHSVRISRELAQGGTRGVFRCSYLPPAISLRPQTGVDEWVAEVMRKIKL